MKSEQEIQAFIFDMDGVLFSTQKANDEAYRQALAKHNIIVSEDFYSRLYGNKFEKIILQDLPKIDSELISEIKKDKHHFYSEKIGQIQANQKLLELIQFSRHHLRIGLATSAAKNNALMILHHFDALHMFDATVFFEDIKDPKPSPECFHLCAKRLNVPIQNCLIWEDSDEGIEAAKRSGARYVNVSF